MNVRSGGTALQVYRELGITSRVLRDAATHFTVYVGPPPVTLQPNEIRVYLSKFGAHCGLFIPGPDEREQSKAVAK